MSDEEFIYEKNSIDNVEDYKTINKLVGQTFLSVYPNKPVGQTFLSVCPNQPEEQTFLSVCPNQPEEQTFMSVCHNKPVGQTFLSVDSNKSISQTNDLLVKKRHLPHWQLKSSYYFITFRTIKNYFLSDETIKITLFHIIGGNKKYYHLVSCVVLNDHVHLIIMPNDGYDISRILKGIKGVSARKINKFLNRSGSVWQDESFDRIIRDEKELNEKINYMLNNPLKRGLTDNAFAYIGWYLNEYYDENV